jgi:pyridoxamine--pyruvate transaminase
VTIVDAVSSFAGIELLPEEWQLDLIVAGPQKCLGGPPGMSLLAVSEQAWAAIDANPDAPRDSFLSITDWRDKWHAEGRFPYTPSVSDLHGVDAAADELLAEGLDASIARHQRVFEACWAGVEAMGLRPWPRSKSIASACVSAIHVPGGLTDVQVRDHARERYGVQFSAGQGAGNLIRVGHMGATARPMLMVAGLAALGRTLADLRASVDVGAGIDAALASLSASSGPGAERVLLEAGSRM